jgi:hypothetical protein
VGFEGEFRYCSFKNAVLRNLSPSSDCRTSPRQQQWREEEVAGRGGGGGGGRGGGGGEKGRRGGGRGCSFLGQLVGYL